MSSVNPETYRNLRESLVNRVLDKARELFASKGVDFGTEEAKQIIDGKPSPLPTFPYLMFSLGLAKDVLDFLDFTIVGTIFVFFFSIIFFFIFFIYSLGKISGGWWKKGLIKWLWKRAAVVAVIEFFPFIQIVPATAVLILLAHYHETKIAKLVNLALDEMHSAGIGRHKAHSRRVRVASRNSEEDE